MFKTKDKFKHLELQDDPTVVKRDVELQRLINPNFKSSLQERYPQKQRISTIPKDAKLQNNGFLSKTLKSVPLGCLGYCQWVGEEVLAAGYNQEEKFKGLDYTIVCTTRC